MIRLQKMIAENSQYSRRKAEELISNGQVRVNGKIVKQMGIKVSNDDEITVNEHPLLKPEKVYYLLNKPVGVVCSRNDNFNRPIITDYIEEEFKIYPVGRLDYNTSGLIVLTNDGELANGLMHPRYKIAKTYIAKVDGEYDERKLDKLRKGIKIDGKITQPAIVEALRYNKIKRIGMIKITIFEGKNQQVRKMFKAIDTKVYKLTRTNYAFFDIEKEKMNVGAYRQINKKEVEQLYDLFENEN